MNDFEKDKFIKDILQKDKKISEKAENIFKNMNYSPMNNIVKECKIEDKKKKELPKVTFWLSGILTVAASFMVVAV